MSRAPDRCPWCGDDPLYVAYHDTEWGVPQTDSRVLFEKLILEGFQAGLSWITILRKRERFRKAFDHFDAVKILAYGPDKIAQLMADPGIVRNRAKIEAAIGNARAYLKLSEEQPFARFLWAFVDNRPVQNRFGSIAEVPAETPLSREIAKALKARGFRFCGPTTVYAMMQAAGLVNDHMVYCRRHADCVKLGQSISR